jgi:hypothetical protein
MLEAIDTSEIAKNIAGGLEVTATLSGIVGLIPVVGTVAGVVGLGADAAARTAGKAERDNSWWALTAEISSVLTKARIRRQCEALERKKE